MISTDAARTDAARKQFTAHLAGDRCHCGGYKWAGFCFCFPCQEKLSPALRRNLFGKSGDSYRAAYGDAVASLLMRMED